MPVHDLVNGRFFCHTFRERSDSVNKLIARLIDAGMPREVAVAVCRNFVRHGTMYELERYVESVEAENREQMESV